MCPQIKNSDQTVRNRTISFHVLPAVFGGSWGENSMAGKASTPMTKHHRTPAFAEVGAAPDKVKASGAYKRTALTPALLFRLLASRPSAGDPSAPRRRVARTGALPTLKPETARLR